MRYRIAPSGKRFAVYRGGELIQILPTRADAATYVKGEKILDRYLGD